MAETSDRCRVVPWHSIRLAMSISLLSFCVRVVRAEGSSCSHKYTEHLNTFPTCSPYINQILKVECTVEVPLNATDISIGWFMDCQELSNNTRVAIFSMVQEATEVLRIRSRLTISDITDDYAGKYTCNMLGDAEYIPSDRLQLGDSNVLEIDRALGPCVDGDIFGNAQPAPEKCAAISEDNPIPMSLVCESPPAISSTSQPPSVLSPYSSISPIITSPAPSFSNMQHPTVFISPSPGPDTTNPQDNINTRSPGSLNTHSLSVIAVSSLLTIIIIQLLSSFVMVIGCKRKKEHLNMCCVATPGPALEEPYYDSVNGTPGTNSGVKSSATINPAYGIRTTAVSGDVFQMNINTGYGVTAGHSVSAQQDTTTTDAV